MNKMLPTKYFIRILLLTLCLQSVACDRGEIKTATIVPPVQGAKLYFRGYVTNGAGDLINQIYYFTRTFFGSDTGAGHSRLVYISNNQKIPFYTQKDGSVYQLNSVDLTNRVIPYRLNTPIHVMISYWEPLLKVNKGVGTEWNVVVDTTFTAFDSTGKNVKIRYFYSGKARYEGWTQTFIPETYRFERVMDSHWYDIKNFIINQSGGDSLFIRRGTAHQYFAPKLGAIKYVTDYTKKEFGGATVFLRGTWELMRKDLPE